MANNPYPLKNVAFTFNAALVDSANRPAFKASPTLATGDVKVSIDGGAFANLATLPTVTPAAGRVVLVSLSAAEMNGDLIAVQFVDAAGAEWDDLMVTIETSSGSWPVDLQTIKTQTVTCGASVTVLASVGTAATSTAQTGDNFARIGAAGAGLTALGDTRIANLDAAVSSRMATYTQPTGFLAATFPSGTIANTTNITAGTITTVGTLTTYTGNTPQTGDSFARIGTAGVGLTNLGDTRIANLDAAMTSRMATYTQPAGFLAATFPADPAGLAGLASAHGAGSWATAIGFAAAGDAMTLTSGERSAVADVTLRRHMASVEASSNGESLDVSSLYGIVQESQEANTTAHAGKLTVFKTDGTTELAQKTLATDPAAEVITGIS